MKIDLKIKTNDGQPIYIGDEVTIFVIYDDSAMASELYGVEPHLDSWVELFYLDSFTGEVIFDEEKMMFLIASGKSTFPLSKTLRSHRIFRLFDNLDLNEVDNDIRTKLGEINVENINNYIIKNK